MNIARTFRSINAAYWQAGVGALICGLLLLLPSIGSSQSQQPSETLVVKARGYGAAYPNDRARSREEALEAAFRDAVEKTSGIFISTLTETQNFELVRDDVLTRSEGFIAEYQVLGENLLNDTYVVDIEAVVVRAAFIDDVNAALELLYRRVGKPRVMVVVKEDNDPDGTYESRETLDALAVTEKEVRSTLLKQGFKIIDARTLGGQSILQAAAGDDGDARLKAIEMARDNEVEILILGHASTSPGGRVSGYDSVRAHMSIDVVRIDNGQVMASESLSLNAVHSSPVNAGMAALKKSAAGLVPALMQQVSYLWIMERNEGARIEVIVKNAEFGDLMTLRQALGNSVHGVQQVQQRSYRDGEAVLEVQTRGDTQSLAEAIYRTQFQSFKVDIENLSANQVTIRIITDHNKPAG